MGYVRRRLGRPGAVVGVVSGGHLLSHLYILAYPPLFPLLRAEFGLTNVQLGLIVSAQALSMAVFQVPAGSLVDRAGAKRILLGSLGVTSLGTALAGTAGAYPWLLAAVLLVGFGQAGFHPANYALLGSATDAGGRGRSFGVHLFAGHVGFALAPVVVGGIGVALGWRTALVAVGAVGLGYTLVVAAFLDPVHGGSDGGPDAAAGPADVASLLERWRGVLSPTILALLGFVFVIHFATSGVQTFMVVLFDRAYGLGTGAGNTALAVYAAMTALGVLAGGGLADRLAPRRIVVVALVAAAVLTGAGAALPIGFVGPGIITGAAAFGGVGLCYGVALTSRDSLIDARSTDEATGKSFGFVHTGIPLGVLVGPVVFGLLIDAAGARVAYGGMAALLVLAALVAWRAT